MAATCTWWLPTCFLRWLAKSKRDDCRPMGPACSVAHVIHPTCVAAQKKACAAVLAMPPVLTNASRWWTGPMPCGRALCSNAMRCPSCGAISPLTSRFCERDGTRLIAEKSATPVAPVDVSHAFDHVEQAPVPELGGVTDRGKRHPWNEDALSLGAEILAEPVHVLVV